MNPAPLHREATSSRHCKAASSRHCEAAWPKQSRAAGRTLVASHPPFFLLLCLLCINAAPWYPLNPAQTLVIDTTKGRIILEMRPDFAPLAVARIKQLSREHVYDGLLFHRVIDHFVDQTGNPNNHDGGVSAHPDLKPEFFTKLRDNQIDAIASRNADGITGFVGRANPSPPCRSWPHPAPGARGASIAQAWPAWAARRK